MLIRRRNVLWAAVVVIVVGAAVLFWRPARIQRDSGPLRHEAYVWQRVWKPEVRERIGEAAGTLGGLVVLAAEVSWSAGEPTVAEVALDYETLKAGNCSVGLAVRINTYPGTFGRTSKATSLVADVAATVIRDARAAGLSVNELQLDFDCPESKLEGYRIWVQAVRQRIGDVALSVTALPSWLDSPEFAPLVRAAGGFVLQVHSLQRPGTLERIPPLCDPERSRQWVLQAARAGVPFRVALPTYGYLLAFDASGAYLGATAEAPQRRWPAGTQYRLLSADVETAWSLVKHWTEDRPKLLTGVLWYRLPIESDRFNWQWQTLKEIIEGKLPRPGLDVEIRRVEKGLVEVDMYNAGNADAPLNVSVSLRWDGTRPMACDTLGEFDGHGPAENEWMIRPRDDALPGVLRPGERRMIAWLRFNTDREVEANVTSISD